MSRSPRYLVPLTRRELITIESMLREARPEELARIAEGFNGWGPLIMPIRTMSPKAAKALANRLQRIEGRPPGK